MTKKTAIIEKPQSTKSTEELKDKPQKNIPIEAIIALRTENPQLSISNIARILKCDKSNISRRLKDYDQHIKGLPEFKKNKADILSVIQSKIINGINESDIKKASLLQKTTAVSQLIDKERLERGQSTENVSIQALMSDLDQKEKEIMERISHKQAQKQGDKQDIPSTSNDNETVKDK